MSFLHASLLGLGALFAVPLIIHLLNRRRYQRVHWAAMEFLLRAYQQNKRRIRLESLLLLLLRCAIPVLLALAVARPRLASGVALDPLSHQGPHHIFILDRSYSMAYRDAGGRRPFDQMRRVASTLIDQIAARSNEKTSLIYLGREVTTPVRGDLETARAQKAIARLDGTTDGIADLQTGLQQAIELVKSEPEPARIYVFSDFQALTLEPKDHAAKVALAKEGATAPPRAAATGHETENQHEAGGSQQLAAVRDLCQDLEDLGAKVLFFPVTPRAPTANTQVVSTQIEPENVVARINSTFRATVVHRGPSTREVIAKLRVDGGNEQTRSVRLRPGEAQEVLFSVRFLEEGYHALEFEIDEDGLPVDDKRRHIVRVRDRIRVLLVEGRETASAESILQNSYLYQHLLDPTLGDGGDELTVYQTTVVDEDRFQSDLSYLRNQDLVLLLDVSALRPEVAKSMVEFVERGGGLLIAPGANSHADLYNARLFGVSGEAGPLPLRLLSIDGFRGTLGTGKGARVPSRFYRPHIADESLEILGDFRDRELANLLEAMPVYRFWGTSAENAPKDTQIALRLISPDGSDDAVLLATRRFGLGECALLTSGLSLRPDRWNRLDDLDAIRFPLVHSICAWLAREPKDSMNRQVGDPLTAWLGHEPSALAMVRPNNRGRVPLALPKRAPARSGGNAGWNTAPFQDTAHAGIYRLSVEFVEKTRAAADLLFAVNPDPREGILEYYTADRLASELPTVTVRADLAIEVGQATEATSSELGRSFLWLALLAALGESVLATFVGRKR